MSRTVAKSVRRAKLAPVVRHHGGADHERLDAILRQAATNLFSEWLRFAEAAQDFLAGGFWVRFKFMTPDAYFEERLGLSYRTVRRWLSVVEGLRRLPSKDRPEAERALAGLGSHKAGALAPVLGKDGQDWQAWVMVAREKSEDDLQARVSVALGHRPRGPREKKGEAWFRSLLAGLPDDDMRAETQRVFKLAEAQLEKADPNPFECWRAILAEFVSTYEPTSPT